MYIVLLGESPRKLPPPTENYPRKRSKKQEVPNIAKDGLVDFPFSREFIQWLKDASFGTFGPRYFEMPNPIHSLLLFIYA